MKSNSKKISSLQFFMLLCISTIGLGILDYPRVAVNRVGPDGWVLIIIGTIIAYLIGLIMFKTLEKYGEYNFYTMIKKLLSKPVSIILCIVFSLHLIFLASMEIRIFTEITREYLLYNTPSEVIVITMILAIIFLIRSGIEVIGKMAQIIFPVISIITFILLIPILREINFTNLLPVLHNPLKDIVKSLPIVLMIFTGIEMALLFYYYVEDKNNCKTRYMQGVSLMGFAYIIIFIFTVGRFGLSETNRIVWPVLELFKTLDIPGSFIENVEIFIISIWILSVFMTASIWYYEGAILIEYTLKNKGIKYLIWPIGLIMYMLSMYWSNISEITRIMNMEVYIVGTFFTIGLPLILLISFLIRKRGGSSNE